MTSALAGLVMVFGANLLWPAVVALLLGWSVERGLLRRSVTAAGRAQRVTMALAVAGPVAALAAVTFAGRSAWYVRLPEPGVAVDGGWAPTAAGWVYLVLAGVYAAGVLLLLGRLAYGLRAAARLMRDASPADPGCVARVGAAAEVLGVTPPPVRVSDRVASPCVVGARRPVLLLPRPTSVSPAVWPDEVLLHELAHVRRRDGLWSVVSYLVRAWFWVVPPAWALPGRVAATAEHACDAVVCGQTREPGRYADLLLRFAMGGSDPRPAVLSVSHFRRGRRCLLRARVERILGGSADADSPAAGGREAVSFAAMLLVYAGAVGVVHAANAQATAAAGLGFLWCLP
ncbi:MAG: M56 family metallopeptidase [Planctomycetota bacterium]